METIDQKIERLRADPEQDVFSRDSTEGTRRRMVAEINANPGTRAYLEAHHGQVWNSDELRRDFSVTGFAAPLVVVTRRSDGAVGTLTFQHIPRLYYDWRADRG